MRGFYEHCILPEPFTILGKDLKPFSFGHYIILRRFGVGCVLDEIVPYTLEDLVFSVFICSHTYEEAETLLYQKQAVPLCNEWGKQYFLTHGEADMETAALEWNRYMEVHTIRPYFEVIRKRDPKFERDQEWYEDVLTEVAKDKNYTDSQVKNYPFCRIYYEYLCFLKRNQIITFSNKKEMLDARKEAYLKTLDKSILAKLKLSPSQ